MESVKTKINGKEWTINLLTYRQWNSERLPKKTWGVCNRDTLTISVRVDLSKQTFLDTLLHELIHAQNELLFEAEETVTRMGTDIARALLATDRIFVSVE
jgi:hypothetical protein